MSSWVLGLYKRQACQPQMAFDLYRLGIEAVYVHTITLQSMAFPLRCRILVRRTDEMNHRSFDTVEELRSTLVEIYMYRHDSLVQCIRFPPHQLVARASAGLQ